MNSLFSLLFLAQCTLSLGNEDIQPRDCPAYCVTQVITTIQTVHASNPVETWNGPAVSDAGQNGKPAAPITITETKTVPQVITIIETKTVPQVITIIETLAPVTITITQTKTESFTSFFTSSLNLTPHYSNTTRPVYTSSPITTSSYIATTSSASSSSSSSSSTSPITCNDLCVSAASASPESCSSLFLTTVYPSPITSIVYATSIQNATLSPVVSTEIEVETDSFTETDITTAGTSTVDLVVETLTQTDSVVTLTSTTGVKTITVPAQKKRTVAPISSALSTVLNPTSTSNYPKGCPDSAGVSSACSCAGVTHLTTTLPIPTVYITSILNGTFTFINNLTSTISSTTSVTTHFISSVEYITTQNITATVETTASTTLEVEGTTTTTAAPAETYIPCTGPPFNSGPGAGGCSSNCYCDVLSGSSTSGFCDNANACGKNCNSNADCPSGQACTSGHPECNTPSGNTCLDYTGCLGSGSKKMFAVRGEPLWRQMQGSPFELEKKEATRLLRGTNIYLEDTPNN